MAKTKVVLRVNTWRAKAGDVIETDADTARGLVENRQADYVPGSPNRSDKG